jgi:hypothetical protein
MAIRFVLDNGEVKEYPTHYIKEHGRECSYYTYHTFCGLEWQKKPDAHEICGHLECAIEATNRDALEGAISALVLIVLTTLFLSGGTSWLQENIFGLMIAGFFLISSIGAVAITELISKLISFSKL